ncbi:MAG: hypothetical protein GWP05_03070 [Anaerolineaceae bacterium]|nr:hypothetical protein [Anaerolineaceae bacterium]
MADLSRIRVAATNYLRSTRIGDSWDFRFSNASGPTLIGSSLAAMLAGLLGWTRELCDQDLARWAARIGDCQRPDGWFEDQDIAEHNLQPGYARDRALLHRTRHALMALEALGAPGRPARRRLDAVVQWIGRGRMRSWCESLDLSDYWYASNMMMDAAVMLLESAARRNEPGAIEAVGDLLDFCDEQSDPETGFHDGGRSERRNAMAGAMHLYPVYVVMKREIPHADRAIETTLSLQQPDGLFGYESGTGGEDCLDYDAAIILSNLGLQGTQYRDRILEAFDRLEAGLEVCRNDDGGYAAHRRQETYYFGSRTTPVGPGQSSIWATYSRLLTCLAIEGFRNRKQPTGWHTAHNLMEVWDGGTGLMGRLPPGSCP